MKERLKTMALNRVIILGRITNDLEVRQTPSGLAVLSFTVAVDAGKDKPAYFIDCVAWKNNAEFINTYFGKGRLIAIEGKLSTRTWEDKQGNKRKVTEVIVDSVSFTGEPKVGTQNAPSQPAQSEPIGDLSGFEEVISDGQIPF